MKSKTIQELASKLNKTPTSECPTIYLLEATEDLPGQNSVARIGGKPIGVTPKTWPKFKRKHMEHLITLDLDEMPELKTGALSNTRAIALFISDRVENEAFEPSTKETAVVVLSQEDIENGEISPALRDNQVPARSYKITPVKVPPQVFDDLPEDQEESELGKLKDAILFSSGYAGGRPSWLQFEEHEGHFLFQFDETLADVNLGDAGVMYVFTDTAFWQCN